MGRETCGDAEPQRPAFHRRVQRAVPEHQHSLGSRLAIRGERGARGRLVERHADEPHAPLPVRLAGVLPLQPRPSPHEVRVQVAEIEDAPVRGLVVHGRERRGRAEQVLFHETRKPRHGATRGRVPELRLGAPAVGGFDAQRQAAADAHRVQPHPAEHEQATQRALALRDARRVVWIAGIHEQGAADHPGVGADVQRVREARQESRGRAVRFEVEDVAVDDDDGVDDLGGQTDGRTGGQE